MGPPVNGRSFVIVVVVVVITSALVMIPGSQAGGCGCPPLWSGFGQHCYRYFSTTNLTWFQAELHCRSFSVPCGNGNPGDNVMGHLVSVRSREEMDFLIALYETVRSKWSTSRTWVWFGLHDKTTENTFEWSDGSPVDYTFWGPYQPNDFGQGQDCSAFSNKNEYEWNDHRCDAAYIEALICKVPKW